MKGNWHKRLVWGLLVVIPSLLLEAKNDSVYLSKLQLADAMKLELDKSLEFKFAEAQYNSQLYWNNAPAGYKSRLGREYLHNVDFKLRVLFRSLPQRMDVRIEKKEIALVDSIYNAFYLSNDGESFRQNVSLYSEIKEDLWYTRFQETMEFQQVAQSLKVGGISKPFTTPKGIYIIQKLASGGVKSRSDAQNISMKSLLEECNIRITPNLLLNLFDSYPLSTVLLTSGEKEYIMADFISFSSSQKGSTSHLWNKFQLWAISKSIEATLIKNKVYQQSLYDAKDSLLLSVVYDYRVRHRALNSPDEARSFYLDHEGEYLFNYTNFNGLLIQGKRKKLKKLKSILSSIPTEEWTMAVEAINKQSKKPEFKVFSGQSLLKDNDLIRSYYRDALLPSSKKKNKVMDSYLSTGVFTQPLINSEFMKLVVLEDYMKSIEEDWINQLLYEAKKGKKE